MGWGVRIMSNVTLFVMIMTAVRGPERKAQNEGVRGREGR